MLGTWRPKNAQEAMMAWRYHQPMLAEDQGFIVPEARSYVAPGWDRDWTLANDALPALSTDPNSGIPVWFSNYVDPKTIEVLFAPNKVAEIYGEERVGNWTTRTAFFPIVESTGEVSSYGDFSEDGQAGMNVNFPQLQAYLWQTFKEIGEWEAETVGLAKINLVAQKDRSVILALNKFLNFVYAFGVQGLQNYGAFNNPYLPAALTPSTKSEAGYGTRWVLNGVPCNANEIINDIQAMFDNLIIQSNGVVELDTPTILALSPPSSIALLAVNNFNVNVKDLIQKSFDGRMSIVTVPQMAALSPTVNQGIAAGNMVQVIAPELEGQKTGSCIFNEKLRAHAVIRNSSSWKQKSTSGAFGTLIRMPLAVSTMIGV